MTLQPPKETVEDIVSRYVKPSFPKPKRKRCIYPRCKEEGTAEFHEMILCLEHLELARFIKWFYYKLGLS